MATSKAIIQLVDENKPNVFSESMKFSWLMELQGQIALNILLMDIAEVRQLPHTYPDDLETELLVNYPHEQIYTLWLEAKIDYANREYDKYENTMQAYNAALEEFEQWFVEVYDPGGRWPNGRGLYRPTHYITAYGLAVMAGFRGSLEEWLESIQGPAGASGVYVGTEEPPEDANIWINPEGDADLPISGGGGGMVACSALGMTPEDANGDNFALLTQAMNQSQELLVDGMYTFTAWQRTTIDGNICLVGKDLSCGFEFPGTGILWDIGAHCGSIRIQGMAIQNTAANSCILFSRKNYTVGRMQLVELSGCRLTGTIRAFDFQQSTDVNPEAVDIGVDVIRIADNTISDNRTSFAKFPDVSCSTLEVCGNSIRNFDNIFLNTGVNEGAYQSEITSSKKRLLVHDNTVICDDSWYHAVGVDILYYAFVVAEGIYAYYARNHVEGMKSTEEIALYDAYLSCQDVVYEGNTWKNNCVLVNYHQNVLMKAKGNAGAAVGTRKYYNNTFLAEANFYQRHNAASDCVVKMIDSVSATTWDIRNNIIDIYRLSGFTNTSDVKGIIFRENKINADTWTGGYLLAGVNGAELICEGNEISIAHGGSYSGAYSASNILDKYVVRNNMFSGCHTPVGNIKATELIVCDNFIIDNLDVNGLLLNATTESLIARNNTIRKTNGMYNLLNAVKSAEVDFEIEASEVGGSPGTNKLLSLEGDYPSRMILMEFSVIDSSLSSINARILFGINGGYIGYTDDDGNFTIKSLKCGETITPKIDTDGSALPFAISIQLVDGNCFAFTRKYSNTRTWTKTRIVTKSGADFYVPEDVTIPEEYQRVLYLESDGSQYIDTGVIPTDYPAGIDYSFFGRVDAVYDTNYIFGALKDNSRSGNATLNSGNLTFSVGGNGISSHQVYKYTISKDFSVEYNSVTSENPTSATLEIDGIEQKKTSQSLLSSNMPDIPIYLLKCNGSSKPGLDGRLYSFKMNSTADGQPIRRFVPCYRVSDGVIGLYDTVGGSFYTNAGTGDFTKGGDV